MRDKVGVASAPAGWRMDRRTFLKALGLSGVGLAAGGSVGTWSRALLAAEAPALGPIDELALRLEFDTERIFRFVSEQIRYEPYAGVLRGAEGTLMARAGNSADQAVLLAALLRASGVACRFAEAPIDVEAADGLLASAVMDAQAARQEFLEALSGTGEGGRPIDVPEPDPGARAGLEVAVGEADAIVDWARGQLSETAWLIETALAEAGIALPPGFSPAPLAEREGHLWVQSASGPAWLDLDPSLPGALPGTTLGPALRTHEELPDELRHRLTFSVIAEVMSGGGLREDVLLQVDDFADALAGLSIGIMNVDLEGLKAIGAGITAALEGGTAYVPCLIAGEDVVAGPGSIRFGGDPGSSPLGELAVGSPSPGEGEPTAEWVRITISSPGAEPVVVQREIFDRLGPASRALGAPELGSLPPAELVPLEPDAPPDYLPAQRSHWLTVHTGTLGGEALGAALARGGVEETLTNVTRSFQVVREAFGIEAGLDAGTRAFAVAPNLTAMTVDFQTSTDGALAIRSGLDIWHRDLGTAPAAGIVSDVPSGLVAGIVPHIAERLLLGEWRSATPAEPALVSVGRVFEAAQAQGIGIRALTSATQAATLPYPADALARLRASLAGGPVAIVPEESVRLGDHERVGWWLVDPLTGRAIDEMDDGRGAVFGEATTIRMGPVRATPAYRRIGLCVAVGFLAGSQLLAGAWGIATAAGAEDAESFAPGAIIAGLAFPGASTAGIAAFTGAC